MFAHEQELTAIALFNCLLNHAGGNFTSKIYIDIVFFFVDYWPVESFVRVLSLCFIDLIYCLKSIIPWFHLKWLPLILFMEQDYLFNGLLVLTHLECQFLYFWRVGFWTEDSWLTILVNILNMLSHDIAICFSSY